MPTDIHENYQLEKYWVLADKKMAGVVGFEPTVHGIKTRGYCYQELSGFS